MPLEAHHPLRPRSGSDRVIERPEDVRLVHGAHGGADQEEDAGPAVLGFVLVGAALVGWLATSVFLHLDFARPVWLLLGLAFALPRLAAADAAPAPEAAP